MSQKIKRTFKTSVREIVDFVLRRGDLKPGEFVGKQRALEGIRGHQFLQRSRPAEYQCEVAFVHRCEEADFILEIQGRMDGVLVDLAGVLIEEIKTTRARREIKEDPLHWAQLMAYAGFYARRHDLQTIQVQLTYLQLEGFRTREFHKTLSREKLETFLQDLLGPYLEWLQRHHEWLVKRDDSIRSVPFPFSTHRLGQEKLISKVTQICQEGGRLFAEAPTGIGKTISTLFPSIKALPKEGYDRIYYATAKTTGRTVAENALTDLRKSGLHLKSLTLTAKEKICFKTEAACDPSHCIYAKGYYDRRRAAMVEAISLESLTREEMTRVAQKHEICPYALGSELSKWVDCVIGDFNHLFDPSAQLRSHFQEQGRYIFLVDEAHNLPDRAREMFSAEIHTSDFNQIRKGSRIPEALKNATHGLVQYLHGWIQEISESSEGATSPHIVFRIPEELNDEVKIFMDAAEHWMSREETVPEPMLNLYFQILHFSLILQLFDDHFRGIITASNRDIGVRLYCIDPSTLLNSELKKAGAAILFSATLSPLTYFRATLGGDSNDAILQLPSPFDPDNLKIITATQVSTKYREREKTTQSVVQWIQDFVSSRAGNYLIYFPSYAYLTSVATELSRKPHGFSLHLQKPGMKEDERTHFLSRFSTEQNGTLIGMAVMGGIFGEGIDLIGERLVGAVIVGVGLPQICTERDLIRSYHDEQDQSGFSHAYVFPGINRVLQAAGRVIRSESDRGAILLIDDRYMTPEYQELLPPWWQEERASSSEEMVRSLKTFWGTTARHRTIITN